MEFKLKDQEYIQLTQLLKHLSLVGSGGEAFIRIDNGEVLVNGVTELQRRKKLRTGDIIQFDNQEIKIL